MMSEDIRFEKILLKFSALGAVFFAVAGIMLGLMSGSQMILFDGLYSLSSVILSLLSLAASNFMHKTDKRFPFGKDVVEPLWVMVKYAVLLLLVGSTGISAFFSLFQGGRHIVMNTALAYSAIGSFLCLLVYLVLRQKSKQRTSALVKAELTQWFVDTILSFGVLAGFGISFLIQRFMPAWHGILPYVDPGMVVLATLYFIRIPVGEMGKALREVLEMSPEDGVTAKINDKVAFMEDKYEMNESFVRVARVGKTLWVEIDFVVKGSTKVSTIFDQDRLREELSDYIEGFSKGNWLTVSFTNARKWAV
jgi:predicted Co/Zn/Cd cation transporter (cation efflux family)